MKREFIILLTSLMLTGLLGTASMSLGAGTWTQKADMPTARYLPGSAVVDGIIYVIGGSGDANRTLSVVEAYNPATDEWTTKAGMPTARFNMGACVIDGRIYVSGGRTKWGDPGSSVPTVEVYDPATDTWTQASDMPTSRSFHTASVVDGKMYIIGGCSGTPGAGVYMSPVVDGKIYIIGGEVGEEADYPIKSIVSTVEEFDPGLPGVVTSVRPAGKLLETWGQIRKVQ